MFPISYFHASRSAITILVVSALGSMLGVGCKRMEPPTPAKIAANQSPVESATHDSFQPMFLNTDPRVAFVDDATCTECHDEIAAKFAKHPMGNSLAPIEDSDLSELFDKENRPNFNSGPFRYSAVRKDSKLFHRRELLGNPEIPVEEIHEIGFIIGSGQRGRSYLIERDDHLYMSPLTWYPLKKIWDLSPGYEHNDLGFGRPVLEDCLFCHANRANLVPNQKNEYQPPIFGGYSIGCQRCHGPGELHVAHHREGKAVVGDFDDTIANPAHLEPALREAVCQQCHLAGVARVAATGQNRYDFRPGMPLDFSIATFIMNPNRAGGEREFVGQVEQMYSSRCFIESDGALGCISCHDPHESPAPDTRMEFYRQKCLQCHHVDDCGEPISIRNQSLGGDDCVGCHMPRVDTIVNHSSVSNHAIPRSPDSVSEPLKLTGDEPIVAFPDTSPASTLESQRNLAIALLEAAVFHPEKISNTRLAQQVPSLKEAIELRPIDVEAKEALGEIKYRIGAADAPEFFESVLTQIPNREHSLVWLANLQLKKKNFPAAINQWQKICDQHPSMAMYEVKYIEALQGGREWPKAFERAQQATAMFPTTPQLWQALVECSLAVQNEQEAERGRDVLCRFNPEQETAIKAWFENHPLRRLKN